MSTIHRGSCLCGAVRFEVAGEFDKFYLCHCSRCRKSTGSAHVANLFSSTATLKWLAGEHKVKRYQIPDARYARAFCTECGCAVPRQQAGTGALIVPAGSLETDLDIAPTAHIFVASCANWDDGFERVPRFEERYVPPGKL